MNTNANKKDDSTRAGGYSLLSAQLQAQRDEALARPLIRGGRGRLLSESGRMFAAMTLYNATDNGEFEEELGSDTVADPPAGPGLFARSDPINIKAAGKPAENSKSSSDSDPEIAPAAKESEKSLRMGCAGYPAKKSFLTTDFRSSSRSRLSRRSTIADIVELDAVLATAMTYYDGIYHLPINAYTVRQLSKHTNGAKPVADKTLFSRLLINGEINNVYAEHVVAALEGIGEYVEHLVIVAPIHTTEFGDAFKRDSHDVNTGSDWENILKRFPNLQSLTFKHPTHMPTELTRETFCAIHCALATGIVPKLKNVQLNVPPGVLANLRMDAHDHRRHGGATADRPSPLLLHAEQVANEDDAEGLDI